MDHQPLLSKALLPLIAALVVLPIGISVLVAVSALLVAMGDATGGVVVRYVALACGILWVIGLICLVLLQGFHALKEAPGATRGACRRRTTSTRNRSTHTESRRFSSFLVSDCSPGVSGVGWPAWNSTMNDSDRTIRIAKLADQGKEADLADTTPAQRIEMMWQLALDAWAFMGEPVVEPRLPRHVVRIVRRGR